MKVKELIEELKDCDPESLVVIDCDVNGGDLESFSPVMCLTEGFYSSIIEDARGRFECGAVADKNAVAAVAIECIW